MNIIKNKREWPGAIQIIFPSFYIAPTPAVGGFFALFTHPCGGGIFYRFTHPAPSGLVIMFSPSNLFGGSSFEFLIFTLYFCIFHLDFWCISAILFPKTKEKHLGRFCELETLFLMLLYALVLLCALMPCALNLVSIVYRLLSVVLRVTRYKRRFCRSRYGYRVISVVMKNSVLSFLTKRV